MQQGKYLSFDVRGFSNSTSLTQQTRPELPWLQELLFAVVYALPQLCSQQQQLVHLSLHLLHVPMTDTIRHAVVVLTTNQS